jgi:hypothetical protein
MARLRDAALRYAERGWPIFPCKPGQKAPASRHGVKDATLDTERIANWWNRHPESNIGLATGAPSGLWIVDIDGDEGLDAFCELGHGVPGTLTAHTPSGGYHLAFHDPGGLGNTASKIAPKVDTRGTGGYIVVSPSVHPNGGWYRWGAKQDPEAVPGWLMRLVRLPPKDVDLPALTKSDLADGYVRAAVDAEVANVAHAIEGTRNDTLNCAAFNLGTLIGARLLEREHAYVLLEQAAQATGLPQAEITSTLGRALDDGADNPRQVSA